LNDKDVKFLNDSIKIKLFLNAGDCHINRGVFYQEFYCVSNLFENRAFSEPKVFLLNIKMYIKIGSNV